MNNLTTKNFTTSVAVIELQNAQRLAQSRLHAWRMNGGEKKLPKDMETSHLFYTLRMIWNNTCPPKDRVGRVKLYVFGPTYTPNYLSKMIVEMSLELVTRKDMPPWMMDELAQMVEILRNRRLKLQGPQQTFYCPKLEQS